MEEMEQMGIERETITESVINGKFNQVAGTYYILAFQKRRSGDAEFSKASDQRAKDRDAKVAERKATLGSKKNTRNDETSAELARVLFQVERGNDQQVPESEALAPALQQSKKKQDPVTGPLPPPVKTKPSKVPEEPSVSSRTGADAGKIANGSSSAKSSHASSPYDTPSKPPLVKKLSKHANLPPIKSSEKKLESATESEKVTLSGLSQTKNNSTKIPVDESLYTSEQSSDSPAGLMGKPRTIKIAFNCLASSPLGPDELFDKLRCILDSHNTEWVHDRYLCECTWGDVKMEMEICKIPSLKMHGLRVKKVRGDVWDFKKLCHKILNEMGLS